MINFLCVQLIVVFTYTIRQARIATLEGNELKVQSCKLINHRQMIAFVFEEYSQSFTFQLFVNLWLFIREICDFLKT